MKLNGKRTARPVVITGGAGFIGTNLAARLLESGEEVILFDSLSRKGVERNWRWLSGRYGDRVTWVKGNVRDLAQVRSVIDNAGSVFHFAAQVAVTTSLVDPIDDFETNARGSLNVLEAIRATGRQIPLLFTSTNKVYGDLEDLALRVRGQEYVPEDPAIALHGIGEKRSVEFHSPYGCSKGAADQYVLDYCRTYGMPAIAFRMSCIYGPHQFGNEDQGWVAHFLIKALRGETITIYGDGRQVRDVLFVEDLISAMILARKNASVLAGNAFNIGGGPGNTISLLRLLDLITELAEGKPLLEFREWRAADQRYYVSDIRKFSQITGWQPRVSVREGVGKLCAWLRSEGVPVDAAMPLTASTNR
jgi:CDP-paratose 2-epimerase